MTNNLEELQNLIKALRELGVLEYKTPELSLTLTAVAPVSAKPEEDKAKKELSAKQALEKKLIELSIHPKERLARFSNQEQMKYMSSLTLRKQEDAVILANAGLSQKTIERAKRKVNVVSPEQDQLDALVIFSGPSVA